MPQCDLVAFVAAGDVLRPDALAEIARTSAARPGADVIYTDEELERDDGTPLAFLKPDWSPELLQSMPYVLHCFCVRLALLEELGGVAPIPNDEAAYDLAFRATAAARDVAHVPLVLCRRPLALSPGHGALSVVARAAGRLQPPGRAVPGTLPGTFRISRSSHRPPVTLVVITGDPIAHVEGRGHVRILTNLLQSIAARSTYPDYRLLVVDDGALSAESTALLAKLGAESLSVPPQNAEFNFARKVNAAVEHVETRHFVLLNDDLEVITADWLEALMDYLVVPEIGAVGAQLLFPDGRVQHAGVVGSSSGPTHRFYRQPLGVDDGHGPADVVRNVSAVTGAVLASRLDVVETAGPFDESFAACYNDVDFCLRVRRHGLRIVYTPAARLYHFEHASLRLAHPDPAELARFRQRWGAWCIDDPYYR